MPYSAASDIVPNRVSPTECLRLCTDDTSVTEAQLTAAIADPSSASGSVLDVLDTINAAIAKADPKIESYCSKRYTVPFSPVPDSIKDASADLATYFLYQRRPSLYEGSAKMWKDAHDSQLKWLKDISTGNAVIDGAIAPTQNADEVVSTFTANERRFTRDKLRGF